MPSPRPPLLVIHTFVLSPLSVFPKQAARSHDPDPASALSFATILYHIVLGCLTFHFPSWVHCDTFTFAFYTRHISKPLSAFPLRCYSILSRPHNLFHSTLDTTYSKQILIILLKHLHWNDPILMSCKIMYRNLEIYSCYFLS